MATVAGGGRVPARVEHNKSVISAMYGLNGFPMNAERIILSGRPGLVVTRVRCNRGLLNY